MGKRDNGSGYIYQRDSGSWAGSVYVGRKDDGKKKYIYFSGKTQAEVKRKIREYNSAGSTEELEKISLGEYIGRWLKTYKYGTVKNSSYDALESTAKNHIIPNIGMINMQQVSPDDIQALLLQMKDKEGLSYSTIKKVYDLLSAAFKHAVIRGDIVKNPMLLVNMPDRNLFKTKEIRIFSEKECALIGEECRRKYSTGSPVYVYGDVYILILNTGLRMGEAIGLMKDDWDREKCTIHIKRNIQSVMTRDSSGERTRGKTLLQNTTKTYSGDRLIPLNKNATEALQRLCDAHPNSEYIVCSSRGSIVPPERLERTFYRVLRNIGIEQTGVHALRHTFASMLFNKKVDVKTVSHLLGHASIQITLNTYIHLIGDPARDAVAVLDDI